MGRRRLLGGIGAITVASLATGRLAQTAEAASRRAPGTLLWQAKAGNGYSGGAITTVVAAGATVYVASNARGDDDAAIYALSAATGWPAWHSQPSGPTPCAAGPEAVYGFQLSDGNTSTSVVALAAATGRALWTFHAGYMLDDAGLGSLAYANGLVLIGGGLSHTFTPASGTVAALDAGTGREIWKFPAGQLAQFPAVADGVLYAVDDEQVVALHVATGTRIWQAGMGQALLGELFTTDGAVIGWTLGGSVFALDAGTGRKLWQRSSSGGGGGGGGIPIFAGAGIVLLVGAGKSANGTVHAINARTATPAWTRPYNQNRNAVAAVHGILYLGIGSTVTAVAAATYRTLWTHHLPATVTGIALAGGVAYVADRHGTVHALVA